MADPKYFQALGRRKSATARIRITSGKGEITINGSPAGVYLSESQYMLNKLNAPFVALQQENKFNISAKVNGGGHNGQVEALQLAIAKVLVEINPDFKGTLKKADLLGRDPREKERKKYGLKSARKQRQFTKR